MTITVNEARTLKKRIAKLVAAEIAWTVRPSDHTEGAGKLAENLRIARKRVDDHIASLRLDDFHRKA